MSDYLSASKAAKFLGCSETLIRKRIQSGVLPARKKGTRWVIARSDLEMQTVGPNPLTTSDRTRTALDPALEPNSNGFQWRDDLLAQVARLEEDKTAASEREAESARREADLRNEAFERESMWKARLVDLERDLTVRDSHNAHLSEQVSVLEAKVREVLEKSQDEAMQLANRNADLADRIAGLVSSHEDMRARVVELQPVAEQVPMLQAAVEEKDASLSKRERELGNMRQDIDAIASRPVTGPVFRLLTKGKLRR